MTYPPKYLQGLLGDADAEALFSDEAMIRAMLEVETALAAAQAEAGDIAAADAARIAEAVKTFVPNLPELAAATEKDGVAVPGLVRQFRTALGGSAANALHRGATSQDIVDSASMLQHRAAMELCLELLGDCIAELASLADANRYTVMAARTRMQQATISSFGLKAAGWMMPLVRWRDRAAAVQTQTFLVSMGGAGGTNAAFGPNARHVESSIAGHLGLGVAPMPWHVQRDGVLLLGGWYAGVSSATAKIATDIVLLCQSEVGELSLAEAGGSSTMPNKRNPVRGETIQMLGARAADLIGALHRAGVHALERDGAAWMREWQILPDLAVTAAAALRHTLHLLKDIRPDRQRMRANVDASNGLLLAEAATFLLIQHMPRTEAQAIVKKACETATGTGAHLFDVLAADTIGSAAASIEWNERSDPALHLGDAAAMIDRALAEALAD